MNLFKSIKSLFVSEDKEESPEVWKEILGTNEQYFISNKARVKSVKKHAKAVKELILTPSDAGNRLLVRISIKGKPRTLKLHRLVGLAFVEGHSDEMDQIRFLDNDYKNCLPENLVWIKRHEKKHHKQSYSKAQIGQKNSMKKLSNDEAESVYDDAWSGLKKQWQIAKEHGLKGGAGTVSQIKNQKRRNHITDKTLLK